MKLSIAEGLYLIALDDDEGKLLAAAQKSIVPGVVGAAILELHVLNRLGLENLTVSVNDQSGTGNRILDNVLKMLKSGMGLIEAIEHLTLHFKGIHKDLNELLVERGILKREATKLLWIPLSERMNNENYFFEQEIRNGMRTIVFKSAKPTVAFVILMSLVHDCHLLDEVFKDKDELVDAEAVARKIVDSPVATPEVSEALKALKKYFEN